MIMCLLCLLIFLSRCNARACFLVYIIIKRIRLLLVQHFFDDFAPEVGKIYPPLPPVSEKNCSIFFSSAFPVVSLITTAHQTPPPRSGSPRCPTPTPSAPTTNRLPGHILVSTTRRSCRSSWSSSVGEVDMASTRVSRRSSNRRRRLWSGGREVEPELAASRRGQSAAGAGGGGRRWRRVELGVRGARARGRGEEGLPGRKRRRQGGDDITVEQLEVVWLPWTTCSSLPRVYRSYRTRRKLPIPPSLSRSSGEKI